MAPNQTLSFLQRRFVEIGLQPDARRGQNFLIDLNLLRMLHDTAQVDERDVVLEVGTGTGSLTALLAEQAAAVVSVEVDGHLHQLASELLIDSDNVTLLHQDALKNKNQIDARVLTAVRQALEAGPERRFKLVANLPYSVATPVLSNLLSGNIVPETMTATIQKELADRIIAPPSTRDYSGLSIWMQSQCRTDIVRVLPPSVFWPRPKVNSAIVQISVDPDLRARIADPAYFHNFVRAMFFHRRKFLRSNLLGAFKGRLDKPVIDEIMAEQGLDGNTRAEELPVETFLILAESLRNRVPDWTL